MILLLIALMTIINIINAMQIPNIKNAHEAIQMLPGAFRRSPKAIYGFPTGYMCIRCGKHLIQSTDHRGYTSDGEPCSGDKYNDISFIELLQRLIVFEEINRVRAGRSHSI